jgi:hypothetical protein
MESRYFGLHHDLTPDEISKALNGEIVWKEEDHGLWAAVIRFNHPIEASHPKSNHLYAQLIQP